MDVERAAWMRLPGAKTGPCRGLFCSFQFCTTISAAVPEAVATAATVATVVRALAVVAAAEAATVSTAMAAMAEILLIIIPAQMVVMVALPLAEAAQGGFNTIRRE